MIDKTGVGVGLVEAGMSILAVTAHLQMTVIRDKGSGSTLDKTQAHETKFNRNNTLPADIRAFFN